jgi:hypothetical protein
VVSFGIKRFSLWVLLPRVGLICVELDFTFKLRINFVMIFRIKQKVMMKLS